MSLLVVDFETRSLCPIKRAGGRVYADHPTTEPLCACWRWDDGHGAWAPGDKARPPAANVIVANNAQGFDRHVWRRLGWPEPAEWVDTAELARMGGFARADLNYLDQTLLGRPKDLTGNRLTIGLSHPRHREGGRWKPVPPDVLARVVDYCGQDVDDVWALLPHLLPWYFNDLPGMRETDRAINDRGFAFDDALADRLIAAANFLATNDRIEAGISGAQARSVPQFLALLEQYGLRPINCRAATLETLYDELHEDHPARLLIEARLSATPIAAKKLQAALDSLSADGRLRDTLAYFGAHTARWAGRRLQPQNLPKGASVAKALGWPDDQEQAAIVQAVENIKSHGMWPPTTDLVSTLARACIHAPPGKVLLVSDYAGIEARGLAWAAGDTAALDVFRSGKDVYKATASVLFQCAPDDVTPDQRQLGKACVLGCGYQMGHVKFETTARGYGVDWSKVPITPKQAVDGWCAAHPAIIRWWHAVQQAARLACERSGIPHRAGPVVLEGFDGFVTCLLPSGRRLVYRGMRTTSEGLVFDGRKGPEHTYGGKLVENIIQALCRDLLGFALIACETVGLCPVLHVHDEPVCEVDERSAEPGAQALKTIMTTAPAWANGLPLAADVRILRRYQK